MRILIVEDDAINRTVLVKLLQRFGDVVEAADGMEAMEAFQKARDESNPFHLICLDIMMPRMDGQAVLKGIRGDEESRRLGPKDRVRIIMTTAVADKVNFLSALPMCDAYLTKPIDQGNLMFYLRQFGMLGANQKTEQERPQGTAEKENIPWVD
jgi:two-component system chemotaxis response regulator CheY